MGLLDSLEPKLRITPCRIRTVLNDLDKSDYDKLTAALEDEKNWPHYTLSKTLRPLGISVSADAITRHRMKVCSCSKI
jgi:hypothetical protein